MGVPPYTRRDEPGARKTGRESALDIHGRRLPPGQGKRPAGAKDAAPAPQAAPFKMLELTPAKQASSRSLNIASAPMDSPRGAIGSFPPLDVAPIPLFTNPVALGAIQEDMPPAAPAPFHKKLSPLQPRAPPAPSSYLSDRSVSLEPARPAAPPFARPPIAPPRPPVPASYDTAATSPTSSSASADVRMASGEGPRRLPSQQKRAGGSAVAQVVDRSPQVAEEEIGPSPSASVAVSQVGSLDRQGSRKPVAAARSKKRIAIATSSDDEQEPHAAAVAARRPPAPLELPRQAPPALAPLPLSAQKSVFAPQQQQQRPPPPPPPQYEPEPEGQPKIQVLPSALSFSTTQDVRADELELLLEVRGVEDDTLERAVEAVRSGRWPQATAFVEEISATLNRDPMYLAMDASAKGKFWSRKIERELKKHL